MCGGGCVREREKCSVDGVGGRCGRGRRKREGGRRE